MSELSNEDIQTRYDDLEIQFYKESLVQYEFFIKNLNSPSLNSYQSKKVIIFPRLKISNLETKNC